ncbi:acid phosphatase [Sclerotinia borealis F-4128]|uniref:Acid phosphatase n=1 Tax=Sclerotinia borealis (strain F-4128) TaxID=1432307 RepID=W9CMF3_SCLBF|nr:acid phosphatase [Sclerotinia borealis F-4128]
MFDIKLTQLPVLLSLACSIFAPGGAAIPTATSVVAPASPTASDAADVLAAQAIAKTRSPVSHVKGKKFKRYCSLWFENTDYAMAAADPNFRFFAERGITLENMFAVTHPSEPNYLAAVGGDYFGLDGDPFTVVPHNVSSIVDLLEDKGISWGLYQEDMPYTGYQGYDWVNQETGADAYVRKHNPEVLFNSVATNPKRLELIKNTTMFHADLAANTLPQWMFITPNMTSDGHDSSITVAGKWLREFLEPLLDDPNFMDETLVLITFDENETYAEQNRVFSVLIGDAVPEHLVNTTDSTYYDHYSEIATVEANWDLHTLGRFDVGANIFSYIAECTGDKIREWSNGALENRYFNLSYPGILAEKVGWAPQPVPNVGLVANKRTVLPAIKKYWEGQDEGTVYQGQLEIPDGLNPPDEA